LGSIWRNTSDAALLRLSAAALEALLEDQDTFQEQYNETAVQLPDIM